MQPRAAKICLYLLSGLVMATITGCAAWLGNIPTVAPLPTLTPSPVITPTPALGAGSEDGVAALAAGTQLVPTTTATITLTPVSSPTFPLGSTSTPDPFATPAPGLGAGTSRTPSITYFVSSPEEAAPGEPVLLIWSAQNGTEAAIYQVKEDGSPGTTWSVESEGALTVIPAPGSRAETYVLTVTNGIATVEKALMLQITCPYTWFFAPALEGLCPEGEPARSEATIQEFEHGRMLWIAATAQIIVLFDDLPTEGDPTLPAWLYGTSTYQEGDPETDPTFQPPEGLIQPRRGFGSVWRESPDVRDRLGWAISEEVPFQTTYQTARTGDFLQITFSNPLGEAITLMPDGQGWLVVGFEERTPIPTP